MLDGLLGRGGFSSKCKSLMKLTKTRIDVIRRKRNATQKFLRKDIADLLSNGLDINAYGRADGLLLEVIVSSCYDFVERCCDVVTKHLSVMQKQRECPEETKVAVSSLMLAAASFSDLPELRDLRQLFYERYRDSLALFEDPDFKDNLASAPCTLENKVRLMKEIASEFSIKWDSKAFEDRMKNPPISPQEPPKAQRNFHLGADKSISSHRKDKALNGDGRGSLFKDRFDHSRKEKDADAAAGVDHRSRHGLSSNGHDNKSLYGLDNNIPRKDNYENPPRVRREYGPDRPPQPALTLKDTTPRSVRSGSSSQRKIEPLDIGFKINGPTIDSRGASPYSKPEEIPIPLPKITGKEKSLDGPHDPVPVPKPKSYRNMAIPPPYIKRYDKAKSWRPEPDFEGGLQRESDDHHHHHRHHHHDHEKDQIYQDEIANPVPKLRSSRRRHSRSHSLQNEPAADFEELPPAPAAALPRKSRSKRRDDPQRRGLQILFDDVHRQKDEEEKIIDRLLIHYSKKPSSAAVINDLAVKPRRKPRSRNPNHGLEVDGSDKDLSSHSLRSVSLPREHSGPSAAAAAAPAKVFARAATFQDRSDEARHVHPKLPDYDELAARFAALRGR